MESNPREGLSAEQMKSDTRDAFSIESAAFARGKTIAEGGLGRYGHLRRMFALTHPNLRWNSWLERQMEAYCDDSYATCIGNVILRSVNLAGCASAGKTFSAGLFAFEWWLADPFHSICILTSTTKEGVGLRMWPIVRNAYHEARKNLANLNGIDESEMDLGNMIESRKKLQAEPGQDERSISAIAVKQGETVRAEAFIRGQHAERVLIAIDEADETPEAIFGATANLQKAPCREFIAIVIANTTSKLSPHGRCCEPESGWPSSRGKNKWKTKGVSDWQLPSGVCLQFRGAESPNVIAGKTVHPHVYSWESYQLSLRREKTLRYWYNDAGEWPPEGFCKTVFDEGMIESCGLAERPFFSGRPIEIGFMDPGFGGDACMFKHARMGDGPDGLLIIRVDHTHELAFSDDAKDASGKIRDTEHQILDQVKELCERYGIEPENFGLYSTGTGRGIASILFTEWSDLILKVEEGGRPSEMPASQDDPRPACLVYDRRVTELWFSARAFAKAGQLKGLDPETLKELCRREYEMVGKPQRYSVETKEQFKPKLGRSPDASDCTVGLVALARERYGIVAGAAVIQERSRKRWEEQRAQEAAQDRGSVEFDADNERDEVNADAQSETYAYELD